MVVFVSPGSDLVSPCSSEGLHSPTNGAQRGSEEGVKGWIRHSDGSNTPCSGVQSAGSEFTLAADCSLLGVNGVGIRSFPALQTLPGTSHGSRQFF